MNNLSNSTPKSDIVLAVSSSSPVVSVAAARAENVFSASAPIRTDGFIFGALKDVFGKLGVLPQDVAYFLLDIGPGSFTGLRVGMACVKMWAWLSDRPIYCIPSLDIAAWRCVSSNKMDTMHIGVVMDAKKGNAYGAAYRIDPFSRIGGCHLASAGSIDDILRREAGEGEMTFYREVYPDAEAMIDLFYGAKGMFMESSPFDVKPQYLYPDDCTIKKA